VDDIHDIGSTIGVSFKGTTHNKFVELSRSKKVEGGPPLMPVVNEGMGMYRGDIVVLGVGVVCVCVMRLLSWNMRGLGG
jgi:hypothetical protein